ncbi:Putative Piwi domain, ribonuclease H-like superfamily [Colletotrichum destructivum]|uniref:Piwi domain, ribonuclease H-like superfamily n=1 Tax=Colletotrichum destructivum TaxID=34406 RepID=A0AAX4J4M4_9PEZI|nr:Putative Piwi domain, ribonuclease H-like superfamily [Colletotrichum destructivum]
MFKSRLRLWKDIGKHRDLPENIRVYRGGVSECQHQLVIGKEVPLMCKACKEMYPPANQKKGLPHSTVVIVGKRHHIRFYPTREVDADRSSNPKPGTIVDRGGTARPAHYFVVPDEIFRNRYKRIPLPFQNFADLLEDLTQSMSYIYGCATKAVIICTPAYYTDILCDRARCYLSGVYDTSTYSAASSVA